VDEQDRAGHEPARVDLSNLPRSVPRRAEDGRGALLIFEQALAEAIYAKQTPAEYTAAVLAAGMREGHTGPIFLQADHDQINAR